MKDFVQQLNDMVSKAFKRELSKSKEPITEKVKYKDIEDYTKKTGKRFRLTKNDLSEGLSREDAFRKRFPS